LIAAIAWAACAAIRTYSVVNASIDGDSIRYHPSIQLIIESCDIGDQRVIILDAQERQFEQFLSILTAANAKSQNDGDITLADDSGTFTVVISPRDAIVDLPLVRLPQVAVLAIGSIQKRVRLRNSDTDSEQLAIVRTARVTLGHDHRLIDGAVAAGYLAEVKRIVENWPSAYSTPSAS
jgi:2-oxoglutarate dehydrogenase E2 component (dihydrolipoamide succinyltransferase)